MTPPVAGAPGSDAEGSVPPVVRLGLTVIAKRADFLRAAQARRQAMPGFVLQARCRGDDSACIRVGYTCSWKIGNAVIRNRAKRRLREVARATLPAGGLPGWDYVLVGRPGATVDRVFSDLVADMAHALGRVHGGRAPK
ncbi:MAG: ribonuclease P protein component [Rhodobacter sp.]